MSKSYRWQFDVSDISGDYSIRIEDSALHPKCVDVGIVDSDGGMYHYTTMDPEQLQLLGDAISQAVAILKKRIDDSGSVEQQEMV